MALAEQVVSHIVALQPKKVTVGDIISSVADYYDLTEKQILAANRSREVTHARHVAAYLSKELTESSLTEIGFKLGKRTHATVLHSIETIRNQMEFDASLRQQIAQIEAAVMH